MPVHVQNGCPLVLCRIYLLFNISRLSNYCQLFVIFSRVCWNSYDIKFFSNSNINRYFCCCCELACVVVFHLINQATDVLFCANCSNENKSFQKGGRGQSNTIFVKGFDKNLEEDQVLSFYVHSFWLWFLFCGLNIFVKITDQKLPWRTFWVLWRYRPCFNTQRLRIWLPQGVSWFGIFFIFS